jgi:hypothetical protein
MNPISNQNRRVNQVIKKKTPVAVAAAVLASATFAQPADHTTSADAPEANSAFSTSGQPTIGTRPFTSFLQRLSSPVERIAVDVAGNNLPADGVGSTDVVITLKDRDGRVVTSEVDVTIEVNGGARLLLPGRTTSESAADRGDIDRIAPGVQTLARGGVVKLRLLAPYKPEAVTLRVSVKGVSEQVVVRYVPELREMIAVGLIEGQLRSDKFDPTQIVPAREDDAFDAELKGFSKEFSGGKSRLGGRAALYLKGKIKGEYLLTLAYDSDKDTDRALFKEVDPSAFYPVYGDTSVRGVDAESSKKLYVRVDRNRSFLLYGDYTTIDDNPARRLSQYSRSTAGIKGHYEEGRLTANGFVAQDTLRQIIDEFPGRGVSGPYSVSNSNGVSGSEKIEIVVRDRNQPTTILKTTLLSRNADYEFEPFSGQILFRAPVPSFDDQLNPVSIRVTYEVDQGGKKFLVYGGDLKLALTDKLTLGVAAARDENPQAPYTVAGASLQLKLSPRTELIAEVARTSSVVNDAASGFNTNTSNNFAGKSGEVSDSAARVEIRHTDDKLRARAFVQRAGEDFNNTAAGITGGRTDLGVSGAYQTTPRLSLNGEYLRSEEKLERVTIPVDNQSQAASVGANYKVNDRLTVGGGVRTVKEDASTLSSIANSFCSSNTSTSTGASGFNNGFGISQTGNQSIDPATGLPVVCSPIISGANAAPQDLDRTSVYGRAAYKMTDRLTLSGELQRELGTDGTNLYRLGADWQVADKTRLYGRYERSREFGGAYGLGVGEAATALAVGIDTQYMQDGSLYSEYRIRNAESGKDLQSAIGLRNGWMLAQGLRLVTNVERVTATSGDATALAVGLEYTASELWKSSGRVEWREDANNTNHLVTLGVARKLDRDWTLLARDYFSRVSPRTSLGTDSRRNRFQVGFAYRPADHNRFDALGLVEQRNEYIGGTDGTDRNVTIFSLRGNYHPSRPWWVSGRLAHKQVNELLLGSIRDNYSASLAGARLTYDVTNRWSVGGLFNVLQGSDGARQYAYGLEVGYVLMDNLWATLGYNWRGFDDRELSGSEYTNRGWVLGLRYKFDEDLFRGKDAGVNKTLPPEPVNKP